MKLATEIEETAYKEYNMNKFKVKEHLIKKSILRTYSTCRRIRNLHTDQSFGFLIWEKGALYTKFSIQWVPDLRAPELRPFREFTAANSACPATLKATYWPLQIRALCSQECLFELVTGRS